MRYKNRPSDTYVPPRTTLPRPRTSLSPTIVLGLTLATILSLVLVSSGPAVAAGPEIIVSPTWALPGDSISVTGRGFAVRRWGQLTLDGSAAGFPRFRTDARGGFDATFVVPSTAAFGQHMVGARLDPKGSARQTMEAATAVLTIGFVDASPTPPATVGPSPTGAAPSPTTAPPATTGPSVTPGATTGPGATPPPGTPGAGGSLSFPIRAAFYYPWFAEAWNQQGYNPFSRYEPSLGYYATTSVVAQHVAAMQAAGIRAGIASWWGQGSATDSRVPALLAAAGSFRWTLYHEAEGSSDPSIAQIRADLTYIVDRYGTDPAYLRVGGKPVVFVYAGPSDGCSMADRWEAANTVGAYVVLKVFSGYRTCAAQPDSWHQYAPAVARDHQAGYSFSISPGFWKRSEATARLARDPARWAADVAAMVGSGEPWQLITTFNEWGEGTGVESTTQFGSTYLDLLRGAPAPTSAPTAAPTAPPTNPPTSPPATPPPGGSAVLVGAGDIASCASTGDEATASLIDGIAGTVFTTGDNVYDSGTPTEFATCFEPSWGRFKARTRPAAGNHDWLTSGAAGYLGYFGLARSYYAYDLGAWRVYVIDSDCSQVGGCGVGSAQHNWLVADLATNARQCALAYWHHPRFSSGLHGSTTSVQPIWQALYDAGAELVINGHDHDYERFAPQTPGGASDPTRGIIEIVAGTGGKNHYAFGAALPNSVARNADTFGVLKLTLNAASFSWQFVPEAGRTFTDGGSASCH